VREDSKSRRRSFNRLGDRAKRVLALAGSEATRLHRDIVQPEHVLLGLLTCGDGISAKALEDSGVKLSEARRALEAMTGHGDKDDVTEVNPSPDTRTIIDIAADEADRAGHETVRPVHLLLALMRQPGSAAPVLESFGASADSVRQTIVAAGSGG
jgi:ATP-dependent Clp protease ATP-binding subunit ClpC